MRRLLLSLAFLLGLCVPAMAQNATPCGGVNFTPQAGVNCLLEPTAPTYAATSVALAPAASATDLACLNGVAGKVIRLQYVQVSGTAGTLVSVPVLLMKHASLDTGGTAATGTALPVPYAVDPNNAAAGGTTTAYTANPTINDGSPGIIDSGELTLPTTAAGTVISPVRWDYQERNFEQAPILRTAAQQICVNINATSPSSGLVNITFKWTELAQ